jgi:hypothetical protein
MQVECPTVGTTVNIKLVQDTKTFYANFAAVQTSPTEIVLRFCLIDPLTEGAVINEESGAIESIDVPVSATVILSPSTAHGLHNLLTTQLREYRERAERSGEE